MSILKALDRTYQWAKERNWDTIYWAVDVHGTILKPDYQDDGISKEFYPWALECLQYLSLREDVKLILYTSSKPETISKYLKYFEENSIDFDYANSNPEVTNSGYGSFDEKFYFNVLLEDKAGFDPETDWYLIYSWTITNKLWPKNYE